MAPVAALAGGFLDAGGFDALTRGKTFYYSSGGAPYGAEEYLDGQRVRWSFLDGKCAEGKWWQEGEMICFAYDRDGPGETHCWTFESGPNGLVARFENDPEGRVLYEVKQSDEPMYCKGPKIGV